MASEQNPGSQERIDIEEQEIQTEKQEKQQLQQQKPDLQQNSQQIQEQIVVEGKFDSLIADIERIKKRHKLSKKQLNDNIDKVIMNLEKTQNNINFQLEDQQQQEEYRMEQEQQQQQQQEQNQQQLDQKNIMEEEEDSLKVKEIVRDQIEELHNKLVNQKPLKNIFNNHKEYFAYLSKVGKNIEKYFDKDINQIVIDCDFKPELIHKIIGNHLMREGQIDLCELLQEETGTKLDFKIKDSIETIQRISNDIDNKNLDSAILWANEQNEQLSLYESNLLFMLHRQKFTSLVGDLKRDEAIEYAKLYFLQFCLQYQNEIQKLMTTFLFMGKTQNSPYADYFEEKNWIQIKQMFLEESCRIYNIPPQSALLLVCTAGSLSLPQFLKLQSILGNEFSKQNKNQDILVEFENGNQFKFHSIFVCPVSREPIDPNQPPQLLKCGHVISKNSLDKITGSGQRPRFKCPTCQTLQRVTDSKEIYYC